MRSTAAERSRDATARESPHTRAESSHRPCAVWSRAVHKYTRIRPCIGIAAARAMTPQLSPLDVVLLRWLVEALEMPDEPTLCSGRCRAPAASRIKVPPEPPRSETLGGDS